MIRVFATTTTTMMIVVLCFTARGFAAEAPSTRPADPPVRIIFDTDMDSDCDDLGAIAVLHALADRGEAEILATVTSSNNPWSAPCLDAINTWYGRPDLPIGGPKNGGTQKPTKYGEAIAKAFPHRVASTKDAPDALQVYRDVLAKQPDGSVTIVTVGYLTNVANLLRNPRDVDLVKAKVKRWVCMGGNFIGHPAVDDVKLSNNNFTFDKVASLYAVEHWPVELVFVGREIGSVPSGLHVGSKLKELPADDPIRKGYELYFGGVAKDRHVADQTTVLYAVRGLRDYWDIETKGWMDLKSDMTFTWRYEGGEGKQHRYLLKRKVDGKPNDRQIEKVIEELMMQPRREPSK
jgi:hypothetical protein